MKNESMRNGELSKFIFRKRKGDIKMIFRPTNSIPDENSPSGLRVYCCFCEEYAETEILTGDQVYNKRTDLAHKNLYRCTTCHGVVGTHGIKGTVPLGVIPDREIANARKHIHALLDPLWQEGLIARKSVYKWISKILGYEYHTAEIRTIEEARRVYKTINKIKITLKEKKY